MKKYMKKVLPFVLSSVMALTAGCAGLEPPKKEDAVDPEEELAQAVEDAEAAEPSSGPSEKESEETQETAALPEGTYPWLVISTVFDSEYKENMGQAITLKYDQVQLAGESVSAWPGLASALETLNREDAEGMRSEYEDYRQIALDDPETGTEGFCYQFEKKYEIIRADDRAVSIRRRYSSFTGGAHGFAMTDAGNFDAGTGKELVLEDVLTDTEAFLDLVSSRISERNEESALELLSPDTVEQDIRGIFEEDDLCWSLDPDGITCYFAPYILTSYAEGELKVKILFSEAPELFQETYAAVPDRYALSFSENNEIFPDLDGDGKAESLQVFGVADQYSAMEKLYVILDGEEFRFAIDAYQVRPCLLHSEDGRNWLYVFLTGDNDYQTLEIFELAEGKVSYLDTLPAGYTYIYDPESSMTGVRMITDPACFELSVRSGDISSYTMSRIYHLGEDGMPVPETDYFRVNSTGYQFKVLKPFKAAVIDPAGREVLEESVTVPEGSLLTLVYSDNGSWVELMGEDGTLYRVKIDSSDWPRTIDGTDIYEIFEGLIFAG